MAKSLGSIAAVGIVIGMIVGAGVAQAELVVLKQSGTAYTAGQRLDDAVTLDVPKDARLELKRLPDDARVEVVGPYKGAIADYKTTSGCPWWNPWCKPGDIDRADRGGTKGGTRGLPSEPKEGGTRGIR